MTCDNYLAMLETLPVEELNYGAAREHVAVCPECNRVTRVVVEREQNMLMAYGESFPIARPTAVAAIAVATARRRRIALRWRVVLALAGAAMAVFVFATLVVPKPRAQRLSVSRQLVPLRCLSASAAADLVRANLPDPNGAYVRVPPSGSFLIIEGGPEVRRIAHSLIDQYDTGCAVREPPRIP